MAEVWPETLPQSPLLEGFEDVPQDSVLRSSFTGYTKQRNRFTANLSDVKEKYYLTPTQYIIFREFYESTLKNGSLEFVKNDPLYDIDRAYRMVAPYEAELVGIDWIVTLTMEKLP